VIVYYPDGWHLAPPESLEDVQAALIVDKNHVRLEFVQRRPHRGACSLAGRGPSAGKGSIPSLDIFRGAIPEKQPALVVPQRERAGSVPDINFRSALVAVILMYEQYFHFVFGPFPIISSHSLKATVLPSSVEPGTPNMTGQNGRQEQYRSVPVRLLKNIFHNHSFKHLHLPKL
jgi:hypothetical protein